MRPTNEMLLLLLLGLLPLLYASWTAWRRNWQELMRLRVVSIFFFWVGFHFGPWYTYLTGDIWDEYLLVPRWLNEGLLFSTLCMAALLIGYDWIDGRRGRLQRAELWRAGSLPQIKSSWMWGMSLVNFVLFVVTVGGWDEVWRASYTREAYLWAARDDLASKVVHVARASGQLLCAVLAAMATVYLLQDPQRRQGARQPTLPWGRYAGGFAALVVASLWRIHFLSRAAGFAFLIFAFLAPRFRGHRALPVAALAFALAVYLGSVGLYGRRDYKPGLGNFVAAAANPPRAQVHGHGEQRVFFLAGSNPLDGMAAWTLKADAAARERPRALESGAILFWNMNPLPSEIVPLLPMGKSLNEIMGTDGHFGLSVPALAEFYYPFGYAGCLLLIPLGMIYAWFERLAIRQPGVISLVCLLMCFVSVPLGVQQNARTFTRPILYALVLYWVANFIVAQRRARWQNQQQFAPRRQLVPSAPGEGGS